MIKENTMLGKFGLELFVDKTPPHINELFGYTGYRRWVAFSWGQEDGFLRFHDGYNSGPGNQLAWDAFFNHPLVIGFNRTRVHGDSQKKFEFGDAFIPPNHWLLSDCQSKRMYAGHKTAVLKFLSVFIDQFLKKHKMIRALDRFECAQPSRPCYPRGGRGLEKINAMLDWLDGQLVQLETAAKQRGLVRSEGDNPKWHSRQKDEGIIDMINSTACPMRH